MGKRGRSILVLAVLLVLASVGGAVVLMVKREPARPDVKSVVSTEVLKSELIGMSVRRGSNLISKTISQSDQAAGQLWQLEQPASSDSEFVVGAFYEQGGSLRKLTAYSKRPLRDSVVDNINLQLPQQFPGYRQITQRNLDINGIEANETVFTYTSKGVEIKQRLVLLIKNSDTAVYIRAQSKAQDYESVNVRYFEPLLSSVKFE